MHRSKKSSYSITSLALDGVISVATGTAES